MKIIGICVGTIEEKLGAISIYQHGISPALARKIVMKTMVSSLSFSKEKEITPQSSEAIIPIQDENIITFTYFFSKRNKKVRGGLQKYSLTVIFNECRRLEIYEEANKLSKMLKNLSKLFLIHLKKESELPKEFTDRIDEMYCDSLDLVFSAENQEEISFSITCPVCTSKGEVTTKNFSEILNIFEHTIRKGTICSHQFQIYLNSDLEIVGYKEIQIDLEKLKKSIADIKTPYDSILERYSLEQEI